MSKSHRRVAITVCVAFAAGFALWLGAAALLGQSEPWDSTAYWLFAYPLTILACGLLGYRFPTHPWVSVVALFGGQFVAMVARNGHMGNLWPLTMGLLIVLAIPGLYVAKRASRLGTSARV